MLKDWSMFRSFLPRVLFYAMGILICIWWVMVDENLEFKSFTLSYLCYYRNDTDCLTLFVFLEGMLWLCTHHCNGDKLRHHSLSEFNPLNSYYLEFGQGGASCFQVWIYFFFSLWVGFNSNKPLENDFLIEVCFPFSLNSYSYYIIFKFRWPCGKILYVYKTK